MKRNIYILIGILTLAACEREIPYNGEYQDPKLVIQSCMCTGQDTITCFVNRSYFFLDNKPSKPVTLDEVTLDLWTSSGKATVLEDKVSDNIHQLVLSQPLRAGDTVRLSAMHPDFGTATAEEILMPAFVPEVKSCVVDTAGKQLYLTLEMPDYAFPQALVYMNADVWYTRIYIRPVYDSDQTVLRWDTVVTNPRTTILWSKDNIFALEDNSRAEKGYYGTSSPKHPGLLLRANYPSGKQIEFFEIITIGTWTYPNGVTKTVHLDSIVLHMEIHGETYQMYHKSMDAYTGTKKEQSTEMDIGAELSEMIGVEESVAIYGNVQNGFGVLTSKTKNNILINDYTIQ